MDYGSKASDISSASTTLKGCLNGVSSSNFNGFWSGSAHDNLTSQLDAALSGFNSVMTQVNSFISAVNKLASYKKLKTRIDEINSELSGLKSPDDDSRIRGLESEKSEKESQKESLKTEIQSILDGITEYSSKISKIGYSG